MKHNGSHLFVLFTLISITFFSCKKRTSRDIETLNTDNINSVQITEGLPEDFTSANGHLVNLIQHEPFGTLQWRHIFIAQFSSVPKNLLKSYSFEHLWYWPDTNMGGDVQMESVEFNSMKLNFVSSPVAHYQNALNSFFIPFNLIWQIKGKEGFANIKLTMSNTLPVSKYVIPNTPRLYRNRDTLIQVASLFENYDSLIVSVRESNINNGSPAVRKILTDTSGVFFSKNEFQNFKSTYPGFINFFAVKYYHFRLDGRLYIVQQVLRISQRTELIDA